MPSPPDPLLGTPVRNRAAQLVREDPLEAEFLVELHYPGWRSAAAAVLPLRRSKRIILDGIGLELWRQVDGRTSTIDLVDRFAEREHLTFHESRLLILSWLQILSGRGLIAVAAAEV